jgi:hypothetical protein
VAAAVAAGFLAAAEPAVAEQQDPRAAGDEQFEKGLSDKGAISQDELAETDKDSLHIGGELRSSVQNYEAGDNDLFLNPTQLTLYFDARQDRNIRAFIKGTATYEPTFDESEVNLLTGKKYQKQTGVLEEMKLMFTARNKVFFTLGKQKIKWGSGRFWNPTDYLNNVGRDPLSEEDKREGVPLLKVHVPTGSLNSYVVIKTDNADKADKTTLAGRVEIPFSAAEIALSAVGTKEAAPLFGADVSFAVGDFDLYAESSYARRSNKTLYGADPANPFSYQPLTHQGRDVLRTVFGISYDLQYGDNDLLAITAEYYDNPEGYASVGEYRYPILAGAYDPFNLSEQYAALAFYAGAPFSYNDFALLLSNLANLTDSSYLTKGSLIYNESKDLALQLDGYLFYGDKEGEMRFLDRQWGVAAEARVKF